MIGSPPIAIDVDNQSPLVTAFVDGNGGVFRLLASRIAFLTVVNNGMSELTHRLLVLRFPVDIAV